MGSLVKKRELLSHVNEATIALSNMSIYAAKLEYHDNDTVSKEFKRALIDFENTEFKKLKEIVKDLRELINSKPSATRNNGGIKNLKQFKQI